MPVQTPTWNSQAESQARLAARDVANVRVTFRQDVWWRNREGIILLIDNMDDRYRRNCANWLLDRAGIYAIRLWKEEEYRLVGLFGGGPYGEQGEPVLRPAKELWDRYRHRMDKGEHIDWLTSTVLYRRMNRVEPCPSTG